MDYQHKFVDQISFRIFIGLIVYALTLIGVGYLGSEVLDLSATALLIVLGFSALILGLVITLVLAKQIAAPLRILGQYLLYRFRPDYGQAEPSTESLRIGKDLVDALWNLFKEEGLASQTPTQTKQVPAQVTSSGLIDFVTGSSPLPVFAVDTNQTIQYANKAAMDYFKLAADPVGKPLFDTVNLSFPSDDTYESWLQSVRNNKVSDNHLWYRVRAKIGEETEPKQFDMAATYGKETASGTETIITLFDQTDHYSRDDHDVGFLALAVHELRTPLTIMRGYIEVFEDELGPTLSPEMKAFMEKLNAAAQQLTAFVSNILNMARVEENQLTLNLREEEWAPILESAINDLKLRAQVHGKSIQLTIDPGIPKVAVDGISIREVINNLIENAVKYGGSSNQILVRTGLNSEGQVETSVQDFGVGIPPSVLPHLFEKFYRSHRSKGTASGTGLGLYLCHAIIKAHGGNISAESHEGKGSTFRFSLVPYSSVASQAGQDGQDGIIRGAHGWIKNHNIYKQ